MRIITWNFNMAFRNKADQILRFNPDILVIPESESEEKINFNKHIKTPKQKLWVGKNINKVLLVASYSDFNSNTIWDDGDKKEAAHTDLVNILSKISIESIYHTKSNTKQGQEKDSTLYLHQKEHKPYHVDYIFSGKSWTNKLSNIEIGGFEDWIKYDDHMPIISDFRTETPVIENTHNAY